MKSLKVSVPIRGLFNLTRDGRVCIHCRDNYYVSVPIRGLFNLTRRIPSTIMPF